MANWLKTTLYSFTNVLRQQIKNHNSDKYLTYFEGADNFPLKWHKIISESPSGTACVSTIQDFLEGFGFSDTELESKIVNSRGETFFQVHQKTCKDFGEFEGFWWHFMYDATGKVTEWEVLPFENCRLGKPDDRGWIQKIFYNPFFGTNEYTNNEKKYTTIYDTYAPKDVRAQIQDQGDKYRGQVLFFGTTNALSRLYPKPEASAVEDWMITEASIAKYHKNHVKNGYLQNFMLVMKGDPSQPSQNPEYTSLPEEKRRTVGQEFDDVVGQHFMGAEGSANLWIQWVSNSEEKPEVITFPANATGEQLLTADQTATKKITVGFKVPSILANINEGVSLGGDGNMIRVAVKLMQQRVIKKQRMLTDTYSAVLKNFSVPYNEDIAIVPYNPYPELEVIDQKIWDALTIEERRKWIQDNTEIELFEDDTLEDPSLPGAPPQAQLLNKIPTQIPETIRKSIKKALDYQDKMDLKCGGRGGRALSEAIINNENMGMKEMKRLHSYLKKNVQFENSTYNEGCGAIQYAAWGGKEMENFLESELKRLNAWLN